MKSTNGKLLAHAFCAAPSALEFGFCLVRTIKRFDAIFVPGHTQSDSCAHTPHCPQTPYTCPYGSSNVQALFHQPTRRWLLIVAALGILILWTTGRFNTKTVAAASTGPSFIEFESGQVRPIAKSPDGNTLFAVNTPNGTLEVFTLK